MPRIPLPIACAVLAAGIAGGLAWLAGGPDMGRPAPQAPPGRPGTAAAAAPSQGTAPGRMAGWGGIANVFGTVSNHPEQDFAAALGAGSLPEIEAAYQRWMLAGPDAALRNAARLPPQHARRLQNKALALLAEQDPAAFLRHAASQREHLPAILAWVADSQPQAALRLLARLPDVDAELQRRLMDALLPRLAATDPNAAAQAVTAMGNTLTLAQVQQVAAGYARKDMALALQWAAQVLAAHSAALGISSEQALQDVAASLVAGAPEAAEQFAAQTGDPQLRQMLVREIAMEKARDDLGAAWAWLQQHGGAAPESQAHAADLLYRWSYARPQEVARLLPALAPSPLQSHLAVRLAQNWMRRDPVAFQNWARSLPPGAMRDTVGPVPSSP